MTIRLLSYIFFCLLITSCNRAEYFVTDKGGYRVKDPTVFEYNSVVYLEKIDFNLIDTNSIYVIDSLVNPYDSIKHKKTSGRFCRFFPKGQVLFARYDSIVSADLVNDKEIGNPGYFTMDGDYVKIDMFQKLNGGQTGKYFGKVLENGDLMFYEQRPETFNESFRKLEMFGYKTYWKKLKLEEFETYQPKW